MSFLSPFTDRLQRLTGLNRSGLAHGFSPVTLSPAVETRLFQLGWAVVILAASLGLVSLIWVFVTPTGPLGATGTRAMVDLDPVQVRSILTRADPFTARGGGSTASAPEGFSLFGTRADLSGRGGSAIIGLPDGTQNAFNVGDEIQPGVTLAAVAPDHVILDQQGQRQTLSFTETLRVLVPSDPQAGPVSPTTDRGLMGLFESTTEQGQAALRLRADAPNALLTPFGLEPGDIIVRLDGKAPDAAAARLLQSGAALPITIKRGDQTLDLTLRIP